jgi:predicted metal-dependent peptidase
MNSLAIKQKETELKNEQVKLQDELLKMLKEMEDQQQDQQDGGSDGENGDGGEGSGENDDAFGDAHPLDEHDWQDKGEDFELRDSKDGKNGKPASGDLEEGEAGRGTMSDELKKMAYDAVINRAVSEMRSSNPGSIPAHIEQALAERFKASKVNWARELRSYLGRKYSQLIESTRNKPNRRLGLLAPGNKRTYAPTILIAVDSSGSVTNEWFVAFMSEIKEILKGMDDKIEIFFFDSEVVPQTLKLRDLKTMPKRPAIGGTNFQKAIDYANKVKPDLLIIFTDGDAHDPKKPNYSLLWALVGDHRDFSHLTSGKKIKIDTKELVEKHKAK